MSEEQPSPTLVEPSPRQGALTSALVLGVASCRPSSAQALSASIQDLGIGALKDVSALKDVTEPRGKYSKVAVGLVTTNS